MELYFIIINVIVNV